MTSKQQKQQLNDYLFGIEKLWWATQSIINNKLPEELKREQLRKIIWVFDLPSDDAMHKHYGDFFMYTDFIYYNMMRDQENEILIKNLNKQENVAQKHNMKIS